MAARAIFPCMEHFVDAHCHFNRDAFADYAGAGRFICNAVTMDDWEPLAAVARADARISVALGVHPWHVMGNTAEWTDTLRQMLAANPHAAVGEIGLDATRDNPDAQCNAFTAQYLIAADMGRAVHIHCVRAWDKMLHLLKTLPRPPVIVAHRFSGNTDILRALCAMSDNIYFSYRDVSVPRTRDAVAETPVHRILVETDGFAPAPAAIAHTISDIAQIRGMSAADMADIIYDNSLRVINNGQIA